MHTYTLYLDTPYMPNELVVQAEFMNALDGVDFIEFTVEDQVVALVKQSFVIAVTKQAVA